MPVYEAPPDDGGAGDDDDGGEEQEEGGGGYAGPRPRQSYNFAPGYHGIVYRADVPDWGAGPRRQRRGGRGHGSAPVDDGEAEDDPAAAHDGGDDDAPGPGSGCDPAAAAVVRYKLQAMKWGLVPFWTKRRGPSDYGAVMKTINCRDDSLDPRQRGSGGGGMWGAMKARKRCVVIAQGFYEWLRKDPAGKEKVPHFVRRRDGRLMCFAGLWDVVVYEGESQPHTRLA